MEISKIKHRAFVEQYRIEAIQLENGNIYIRGYEGEMLTKKHFEDHLKTIIDNPKLFKPAIERTKSYIKVFDELKQYFNEQEK